MNKKINTNKNNPKKSKCAPTRHYINSLISHITSNPNEIRKLKKKEILNLIKCSDLITKALYNRLWKRYLMIIKEKEKIHAKVMEKACTFDDYYHLYSYNKDYRLIYKMECMLANEWKILEGKVTKYPWVLNDKEGLFYNQWIRHKEKMELFLKCINEESQEIIIRTKEKLKTMNSMMDNI